MIFTIKEIINSNSIGLSSNMLESSLEFLKCVNCGSKLELDLFKQDKEIIEGILECPKCNGQYPIIEKIPILWNDFSLYLSSSLLSKTS